MVYQYILEYYTTTKRPGGETVTTTEWDVGRAVNEPELLNHEETKREAESFKERRSALCQKDYSDAYGYYAQIRFLKNASCYAGPGSHLDDDRRVPESSGRCTAESEGV